MNIHHKQCFLCFKSIGISEENPYRGKIYCSKCYLKRSEKEYIKVIKSMKRWQGDFIKKFKEIKGGNKK